MYKHQSDVNVKSRCLVERIAVEEKNSEGFHRYLIVKLDSISLNDFPISHSKKSLCFLIIHHRYET